VPRTRTTTTRRRGARAAALTLCLLGSAEAFAAAESSDGESQDLQKAVQNPVANLISVPFQNNINYQIGSYDRSSNTLNIQPVIPAGLTGKVMLISRIIIPLVDQPDVTAPGGQSTGLGDVNPTFFFAPAHPGMFIWGLGPSFLLATGTQQATGSGKWCAGPSVVVLVQPAPWTIGALVNNLWSFAGQSARADVNQMTLQYFVNYNLNKALFLTSSPIITANWEAAGGERWVVPFGGGLGALFKVGRQPMNAQLAAFYNAVTPNTVPTARWQLRLQLALLFPR